MSQLEQATLGAGCFWGAEATIRALEGVIDTRVGYASAPDEAQLKIEVVQVDFDPAKLSYSNLIEQFWGLHDPTSVDRQGADTGVKYRSAIFIHSAQQHTLASHAKQQLEASGRYSRPVVTHVLALGAFEMADEEQQRYLEKHGKTSCSL